MCERCDIAYMEYCKKRIYVEEHDAQLECIQKKLDANEKVGRKLWKKHNLRANGLVHSYLLKYQKIRKACPEKGEPVPMIGKSTKII